MSLVIIYYFFYAIGFIAISLIVYKIFDKFIDFISDIINSIK